MSAAVDSADVFPTGPICGDLPASLCEEQDESPECAENGLLVRSPSADENSAPLSPQSPSSNRVGFSVEVDAVTPEKKDRERYLTAKYPKHQTGLIRKRLAVEDWVDAELKILFNIGDDDYETYDTLIDLDELLNFNTDEERTDYIQQKIAHAPKPPTILSKFTDELLKKAHTL